ncbi:MAG: hypothetical protein V1870_02845 [Candidatus Aenigmatarchaeota archaeon]
MSYRECFSKRAPELIYSKPFDFRGMRGNVEIHYQQPYETPHPQKYPTEPVDNKRAISLIESWMKDESGHDERVLSALKHLLH